MKYNVKKEAGVTLAELIIVMGLVMALLGYATINLLGSREKASLTGTVNTLIADLKHQQIKSMVRDREGRDYDSMYGIYFEGQKYTLFHDTYNALDPNFTVNLDDTIQITNTFLLSQIFFASGSGEIVGFIPGSNTITITSTGNNEQKTIQLNRYGVVTNSN